MAAANQSNKYNINYVYKGHISCRRVLAPQITDHHSSLPYLHHGYNSLIQFRYIRCLHRCYTGTKKGQTVLSDLEEAATYSPT